MKQAWPASRVPVLALLLLLLLGVATAQLTAEERVSLRHGTYRSDFTGAAATNRFDLQNRTYLEGVASYVAIGGVLAVLFGLYGTFLVCRGAWYAPDSVDKSPGFPRFAALALAGLALLFVVLALSGNYLLSRGMRNYESGTQAAQDKFTDDMDDSLTSWNAINDTHFFASSKTSLNATLFPDLRDSADNTATLTQNARSLVFTYEPSRSTGVYLLLLLPLLASLTACCGLGLGKPGPVMLSLFLVFAAMILLWVTAGASFAYSLLIADYCVAVQENPYNSTTAPAMVQCPQTLALGDAIVEETTSRHGIVQTINAIALADNGGPTYSVDNLTDTLDLGLFSQPAQDTISPLHDSFLTYTQIDQVMRGFANCTSGDTALASLRPEACDVAFSGADLITAMAILAALVYAVYGCFAVTTHHRLKARAEPDSIDFSYV